MKSKYLFPILGLAALGAVSLGTIQVLAHNTTSSDGKTIVQKLAERFNLPQGEVQQVFDDHKTQLKTDMQKKVDDRLSQAVTEGKLTEEQKQKILAKQKELQSQMAANRDKPKDMTPEQSREEMQKQRDELEKWAKDNGIDTQYLMGPFMKGDHKGFRGGPRPF
jgi:hypothetical protein